MQARTPALLLALAIASPGCDVYRDQVIIVPEDMQPGWIVVEFGNSKCPSASGLVSHRIELSAGGCACTSNPVPGVFNIKFLRKQGSSLVELDDGVDVRNVGHTSMHDRRYLIAEYRRHNQGPQQMFEFAVERCRNSNPN